MKLPVGSRTASRVCAKAVADFENRTVGFAAQAQFTCISIDSNAFGAFLSCGVPD